jgi:hypothetical protein
MWFVPKKLKSLLIPKKKAKRNNRAFEPVGFLIAREI